MNIVTQRMNIFIVPEVSTAVSSTKRPPVSSPFVVGSMVGWLGGGVCVYVYYVWLLAPFTVAGAEVLSRVSGALKEKEVEQTVRLASHTLQTSPWLV